MRNTLILLVEFIVCVHTVLILDGNSEHVAHV